MPYIAENYRISIDNMTLKDFFVTSPGELNYAITKLLLRYAGVQGGGYETYNEILGAIEAAKLEFYRRKVAPYEEQKRFDNGDIAGY